MKNFTYFQPATVAQAVNLLDGQYGKTELLAGGTDLLDLQKEYVAQPEKIVSLTAIPELRTIAIGKDAITIGAGAKLSDIANHPELQKLVPALTATAAIVGGPQIRNMGTLGGNLCQRNRCWYFRDEGVKCLLKGGDKCYALAPEAENRYHAVFTQGCKCVIVNPSTLAPVTIALHGSLNVVGPNGKTRIVKMKEMYQAPANASQREHVIAPNEVIVSLILPIPAEGGMRKSGSYEVRQKQSYDWPMVQAAAAFQMKGDVATGVRVVLGHVAPTPIIAEAVGTMLEGKPITEATVSEAAKRATEGAKPLSQNAYKLRLIEVAVKRALLLASGAKPYWEG